MKNTTNHKRTMAILTALNLMEAGSAETVMVTVVLLQDIDLQKGYSVAQEIAKGINAQFTGLNIFTVQTPNALNYYNSLNFTVELSHVNQIQRDISTLLKINSKFIKVVVSPLPLK